MSEGKLILTCGHTNMPLVGVWEPETDERGNRCRSYSTFCPVCAEDASLVMVKRIEELEAENDALKADLIGVRAKVYYMCREMKEAIIAKTSTPQEGEE